MFYVVNTHPVGVVTRTS